MKCVSHNPKCDPNLEYSFTNIPKMCGGCIDRTRRAYLAKARNEPALNSRSNDRRATYGWDYE